MKSLHWFVVLLFFPSLNIGFMKAHKFPQCVDGVCFQYRITYLGIMYASYLEHSVFQGKHTFLTESMNKQAGPYTGKTSVAS